MKLKLFVDHVVDLCAFELRDLLRFHWILYIEDNMIYGPKL